MSIHLPLTLTFAPLQFFPVWKNIQMNALRYRKPPMFTKVALKDWHEMELPLHFSGNIGFHGNLEYHGLHT